MKTLKLFDAVVAKPTNVRKPFVSEDGYVIALGAIWAKDRILAHYAKELADGEGLNSSFHKSWKTIKETPRGELRIQQIMHYLSTYGTGFSGDIHIPDEVVKVPGVKVVFRVVRAYTEEQLTQKCLDMLRSGAALKEETVDDLISVLSDELRYSFTGKEGIRNKEAVVKIADLHGVVPDAPVDFLRYVVFRATGSALLIKNPATFQAIRASSYNPKADFERFGLARLGEHFNRFKPIFLAFKPKCRSTVNEVRRWAKTKHKPMVQNPLNLATTRRIGKDEAHWLDNATPYALFKVLSALHLRAAGQTAFMHRIRNGKSFVREADAADSEHMLHWNLDLVIDHVKRRFGPALKGKKIFVPADVAYALPTSEKMYVGNIPTGTKFYGTKLAVGVYWRNEWGANDLDLSGLSAEGKVGWNASYGRGQDGAALMYSGDVTDAPNGAVEYLYAQRGVPGATLVLCNVYRGAEDSEFNIVVGRGDNITYNHMVDPNKLFVQARIKAVQTQTIVGLLQPEGARQAFVLLALGAGRSRVSGYDKHTNTAKTALLQEWRNPFSLNWLLQHLGAKFVASPEKADVDLSIDKLERDTFIKLFQAARPKPRASARPKTRAKPKARAKAAA